MPARKTGVEEEHGTMVRYRRGCRCPLCKVALSVYQAELRARHKRGRIDRVVSAQLARDYLRELQANGIGIRAVADATGIQAPVIQAIRAGRWKRIRESTEIRIMQINEDALADGSLVDGAYTTRYIDALLEEGFTMGDLATRLGYSSGPRGNWIQFYRKVRVTARNASRVERLYRLLMEDRTAQLPPLKPSRRGQWHTARKAA